MSGKPVAVNYLAPPEIPVAELRVETVGRHVGYILRTDPTKDRPHSWCFPAGTPNTARDPSGLDGGDLQKKDER